MEISEFDPEDGSIYSASASMKKIISYDTNGNVTQQIVQSWYDERYHEPHKIVDTVLYSYDDNGLLSLESVLNGGDTIRSSYIYDEKKQLRSEMVYSTKTGTYLSGRMYEYDSLGRLI